jgi:hypothetical protein
MTQVVEDPSQVDPTPEPTGNADNPTSSTTPRSVEDLERDLAETRKEAKGYRLQLREYQKSEEERRQASLSESEKIAERAAEAEKRLAAYQDRLLKSEIKMTAQAAQFAKPEMAFKFIDADAIEYDDNGDPTNLGDLFAALKESEGWLFNAAAPVAPKPPDVPKIGRIGSSAGDPNKGANNVFSHAAVKAMSPEEYAKIKVAYKQAIIEGRVID